MKKIYATPCMKVYNVCGNSAFLTGSDGDGAQLIDNGGSNAQEGAPKDAQTKDRGYFDLWDNYNRD